MRETSTPEDRRDITLGKYTYIWISAEAIPGDLAEKGPSQDYKPNKKRLRAGRAANTPRSGSAMSCRH